MTFNIVACGIFRPELEKILPEIKKELGEEDIPVVFLSPALHLDNNKMADEIIKQLDATKPQKTVLLYGSMCHTNLASIVNGRPVAHPQEKNCIELILSAERKEEIDKSGNVFYLSCGWLKYWREIFQHGMEALACDRIVALDCGLGAISDEEMLEFSDCIHAPIEIEEISLDHFKETVLRICKESLCGTSTPENTGNNAL
ncbi:MAG: DUF1638 domain-containing protein [Spirochaetaceae bacterium]|jgi:hypothetical protein|nr:DUF1638 domain-containing protein [Spirochaetaceae bacterium]